MSAVAAAARSVCVVSMSRVRVVLLNVCAGSPPPLRMLWLDDASCGCGGLVLWLSLRFCGGRWMPSTCIFLCDMVTMANLKWDVACAIQRAACWHATCVALTGWHWFGTQLWCYAVRERTCLAMRWGDFERRRVGWCMSWEHALSRVDRLLCVRESCCLDVRRTGAMCVRVCARDMSVVCGAHTQTVSGA